MNQLILDRIGSDAVCLRELTQNRERIRISIEGQKEMVNLVDVFGTLGPACDDIDVLSDMLKSGMTGIRLNLSHTTLDHASAQLNKLREASVRTGMTCKLLIDLQGPELRIGDLKEEVLLRDNARISVLQCIPFPDEILNSLKPGQQILLDDGKILLEMEDDEYAKVLRGGLLSGRKSVALPGASIARPALTKQDHENLACAAKYGVTGVMQPFVRSKEDLIEVRTALKAYGGEQIRLYAKVENEEGVSRLSELLPYTDEIVIARGDLGNAVSLQHLPAVQKQLSRRCREAGKPFMVVTQMLASMEHSPVPTRAEVSDIFNAVLDGASSVMVTGETALGKYPVEAIRVLSEMTIEAERFLSEEQK